jgi:hypothetical protein
MTTTGPPTTGPPTTTWGAPPPTAPKPTKTPLWRRTWVVAAATGLAGLILGSLTATSPEPQVRTETKTVTQVSVQEIPTFKESCSDYERLADIAACRAAQEKLEVAAAPPTTVKPTPPKPAPAPSITDGTYEVGSEVKAGTYKSDGGECYWERLKGFSGDFGDIIANDNTSGPSRMTIRSSDNGVTFSGGCEWTKVS